MVFAEEKRWSKLKKKLIEVALPLEAINKEAAREKSIRHGHPSTLHLWWARRPLAACRAVLFASLVDDPSSHPEDFPTEADQDRERQRLFRLLEELVKWENSNNRSILDAAHKEILKSTDGNPPPIYDPFCGGGSIPLEAQRLGLEAHASDLNPVAVLITKALIEIPPKFSGQPPVNPAARKTMSAPGMWTGARGLADDLLYYGRWMRDRAWERIGHLYPKVKLPKEHGGGEATVIAWLWARTVTCPNPACGAQMPLVRTLALSTKKGRETWLEPVVDNATRRIEFRIARGGQIPDSPKVGRGSSFRCLSCGQVASDEYIKDEGCAGRLSMQMTAVAAEGSRGRVYVKPSAEDVRIANSAVPAWGPQEELAYDPRAIWCTLYGLSRFCDLFTKRQLLALATLSELVQDARQRVRADAIAAGIPDKQIGLEAGGSDATAYADAVTVYLSFVLSRQANYSSALCAWSSHPKDELAKQVFMRQGLPMVWDFAETNLFSNSGGTIEVNLAYITKVLLQLPASGLGAAAQIDAAVAPMQLNAIATDPPYYDNIGYADLSDFFYVWLRHTLLPVYPVLFSTLLVPKKQELVAIPYRHGSKELAQEFFKEGFSKVVERMRASLLADYPLTMFYAFKQSETNESESSGSSGAASLSSTGWETMLDGLLTGGFQVVGTWPIRTELVSALKRAVSALSSSFVLVCRPRSESAQITTRKDFLLSLKRELPRALRDLQKGNIAPVDLAQAAIGPGMAVFSRYKKVLESDGNPMRVRAALALINQTLDEVLSEQESDFDPDTRWALAWFEQNQFSEGLYGQAEVLATAKAVSISGLVEAGIVHSRAGKVRLLKRNELPVNWDPTADGRLTVWEVTQHLIRCLETRGEADTAALKAKIGGLAETARELAYRLYTLCERKGWAEEAGYYNSLVVAWPAISHVPALFQQQ
jgi:putative DNA methylase